MICDDFWKKNELASLLSNVPNTFPNNGGSLIIPRAYSCAESENCINGKCQTPISNIQIQPITINPNLMGVIKKT